jgi:hypothetical protein
MVSGRPSIAYWTTMITVWSVGSHAGIANFSRRSTTGITLPRRLITPRTNSRVRGTRVISMRPMISLTFRISSPYSSFAIWKVMYLPASRFPSSAASVSCGVFWVVWVLTESSLRGGPSPGHAWAQYTVADALGRSLTPLLYRR